MKNNVKVSYKRNWAWGWGVFLLLVAALILSNQFGGFLELGIWSIIVSALAVAFMVQCIIDLSFASLPIPLAALYYIFQTPLDLPEISFWPLAIVTLLATIGLHALIPNRLFRKRKNVEFIYSDGVNVNIGRKNILDDDGEIISSGRIVDDEAKVEEGGSDNNPRISVQFGSVSRYLHANSLETVDLDCSFGALEVYFDHVELSPNGAEAFLNCKFGAIELYVPSNWNILDNMNASLGGVDIKGRHKALDENAPQLKISGNVSLGGVEVHRI